MGLLEKIRNIFEKQPEKQTPSIPVEQEVQKDSYDVCIVDFANILSFDLSYVFEKTSKLSKNPYLDFYAVINTKRKEFFEKIEVITSIFRKFPVAVYFTNGETDIEITRLVNIKLQKNQRVLVLTNDFTLIDTIATRENPKNVSFVLDEKHTSSSIPLIKNKGFTIYQCNFLTRKEGVIRRILKMKPSEVKMSRGYMLSDKARLFILDLLPTSLSQLTAKTVESNIFKDGQAVKMALAYLCNNNEIEFLITKENPNEVLVKKKKGSKEFDKHSVLETEESAYDFSDTTLINQTSSLDIEEEEAVVYGENSVKNQSSLN